MTGWILVSYGGKGNFAILRGELTGLSRGAWRFENDNTGNLIWRCYGWRISRLLMAFGVWKFFRPGACVSRATIEIDFEPFLEQNTSFDC